MVSHFLFNGAMVSFRSSCKGFFVFLFRLFFKDGVWHTYTHTKRERKINVTLEKFFDWGQKNPSDAFWWCRVRLCLQNLIDQCKGQCQCGGRNTDWSHRWMSGSVVVSLVRAHRVNGSLHIGVQHILRKYYKHFSVQVLRLWVIPNHSLITNV